jgi:hypothetical protein
MRTLMRDVVPPALELGVEILDIDKRARRKEGVTQILDLSLDFPLLVPPRRRTRPWREVVMPGELEQAGMKADGGAGALEHRTAQIVVNQGSGDAVKRRRRRRVREESSRASGRP